MPARRLDKGEFRLPGPKKSEAFGMDETIIPEGSLDDVWGCDFWPTRIFWLDKALVVWCGLAPPVRGLCRRACRALPRFL